MFATSFLLLFLLALTVSSPEIDKIFIAKRLLKDGLKFS